MMDTIVEGSDAALVRDQKKKKTEEVVVDVETGV